MKRLIIAAAILSAIIAVSSFSHITVEKVTAKTDSMLVDAENSANAGNMEDTKELCSELIRYWDKKAELISLFANHSKVEDISVLLKKLEISIGTQNFYLVSGEIKLKTDELKTNEKISAAGF